MNHERLVGVSSDQQGALLLDIKYVDCRTALYDRLVPTFPHRFGQHAQDR